MKLCLRIFILVVITVASVTIFYSEADCPFFECPTDESYPKTCLDNVIPPWPICKFGTVEKFVAKAKDGATRCCGDDLSACKCPKKDTDKFLDEIGPWCDGVSTCDDDGKEKKKVDVGKHFEDQSDYAVTE